MVTYHELRAPECDNIMECISYSHPWLENLIHGATFFYSVVLILQFYDRKG